MSSRKLDDLRPDFRPMVFEFLARLVEAGIVVTIVMTLRNLEEQKKLKADGYSKTLKSKHLLGLAIDVVPDEVRKFQNWAPEHPLWKRVGEIGMACGLRWGYNMWGWDMGHFEAPSVMAMKNADAFIEKTYSTPGG